LPTKGPYLEYEQKSQLTILKALHLAGGSFVALFAVLFFVLGFPVAAGVEAVFLVSLVVTYAYLHFYQRRVREVVWIHIVLVYAVTLAISFRLGGFHTSGVFQIWSLISPLAAVIFLTSSEAIVVSLFFVLFTFLGVSWQLDPAWTNPFPERFVGMLTAANVVFSSSLALFTLLHFLKRFRQEHAGKVTSERHLKALYDASPDMILLWSDDREIVDANETLLKRMRFSREQLLVEGDERLRELIEAGMRAVDRLENCDEISFFELECNLGNAEVFPSEVRVRTIVLPSDLNKERRNLHLAVITDITTRKKRP